MRRCTLLRGLAPVLAIATALVVAGCEGRRTSLIERVVALGIDRMTDRPIEVPPLPSRAQLDEVPYAMIALSRSDSPGTGFVTPIVDNDGYLVYQDASRRSVVMKGGLLAATLGFSYDLAAVKHQQDDPVAIPTPVASWPGTLYRNYQFTLQSRDDFEITVRCILEPVVRERIEIFELTYDLMRVQERCGNGRRTFTNTYWVEPETGFIWKSEQWVGPRVTPFTVEIIHPYSPG